MEHLAEGTAIQFLEGGMSPGDAADVEAHIDECPNCRMLLGRLAQGALIVSGGELDSLESAGSEGEVDAFHRDILLPGELVGRYVVRRVIGVGGMGVVYAADDPDLGRQVAIKVLHPGRLPDLDVEEGRLRMLREGAALAALSDPHVVAVHDVGTHGDQVFLAMERVEGVTLRAWLKAEPRSWRQILDVFLPAGQGLAVVHAAGIVHRDFKPENVLVGSDGRVRVTDFGLARRASLRADPEAGEALPGPATVSAATGHLTESGLALGTPRYMAPEQRRGDPVGPETDQYSFCLALWEALHGALPRPGAATARERPKEGHDGASNVPAWLRRVLARGLNDDPRERYPSMEELLGALEADPWRRRRRWLAASALVVLVGSAIVLGSFLGQRAPSTPVCDGAPRLLEEAWGASRREAVRAAFFATKLPYAQPMWKATAEALDRSGHEWAATHRRACLAGVRGEQPPPIVERLYRCLEDRRTSLKAVVSELLRADDKLVERSLRIVGTIPDAKGCERAAVLGRYDREPARAESRARLNEVRERVARALALHAAGRYRDGLREAEAAVAQARAIDYRPLVARALRVKGILQARAAKPKEAEQTLHGAAVAAQGAREDEEAARAWTALVGLVGSDLARRAEGLRWAEYARAAIRRIGGAPLLEAKLSLQLGRLSSRSGRARAAREHLSRALELRKRHLGDHHPGVADALNWLGIVAAKSGRYERAGGYFQDALAIFRRAFGPYHPRAINVLHNLGNIYRLQGRLRDSLSTHRRILALERKRMGPEHPRVASSLNSVGNALDLLGRHQEAAAVHRRALAIRERVYGPSHPDVATSLGNLAIALTRLRRYPDALRLHRRELAIYVQRFGPDHPDAAATHDNLGMLLRRMKRNALARRHHRQALAIWRKRPGRRDARVATSLFNLGLVDLAEGRLAPARRRLRRALALREKRFGRRHPGVSEVLGKLSEIARRQGNSRQAAAWAREATAAREPSKGRD